MKQKFIMKFLDIELIEFHIVFKALNVHILYDHSFEFGRFFTVFLCEHSKSIFPNFSIGNRIHAIIRIDKKWNRHYIYNGFVTKKNKETDQRQ